MCTLDYAQIHQQLSSILVLLNGTKIGDYLGGLNDK